MAFSEKRPSARPGENTPAQQQIDDIPLIWDREADNKLFGGLFQRKDEGYQQGEKPKTNK